MQAITVIPLQAGSAHLAKACITSSASPTERSGSPRIVVVTGPGPSACWPPCSGSSAASRSTCWTRVTSGPKRGRVADLGATCHTGTLADAVGHANVVVECTGVGELVFSTVNANRRHYQAAARRPRPDPDRGSARPA
jgi:hypothetical protein